MGRERKLQKKIQKYQERLERSRRRRERYCRSADRSRSRSPIRSPTRSPSRDYTRNSFARQDNNPPTEDRDTAQERPLEIRTEGIEQNLEPPAVQTALLQALGKDYEDTKKFEGPIHQDITKRWAYVLIHGLNKTEREEIIKAHNVPENCKLLAAPKLNDEVGAALTENSKHRDKGISHQQQQLGTAVAIIGKVMSNIIDENNDEIGMLKSLGEAAKLLTDLHHQQTKTRRVLVAPLIEKSFLQLLENTQRDEYLYGDNICEKIKSHRQLQQNSTAIKKPVQRMAAQSKVNKPTGNRQGPPQQTNTRQPVKAMARGGLKYRAAQPSPQQRPTYNQQRSERTRGAYNNRR